jgi:NADH-quinone oxidoreductase subunit I
MGQFLKPTVTVHYPHETLKIPKRFRGHIELVRDPQTGMAKCFVCKLCEKACPSDCITVEGVKPEGARRKTVTYYRLDFTKCSLCGSCVEACRDGAIRFSREYNLAGLKKEDFIMDLFKRLEAEAGENSEGRNPKAEAAKGAAVSTEPAQPKTELQKAAPVVTPQATGQVQKPAQVSPEPPKAEQVTVEVK